MKIEYYLSTNADRKKIAAIISCTAIYKPIKITVESIKKKRTKPQNGLYWSSVLPDCSEQVDFNGKFFSQDHWHEHLKTEFLPESANEEETLAHYVKWEDRPKYRRKMVGSTTDLTVKGFENYLHKCYAYGGECGVRFRASP